MNKTLLFILLFAGMVFTLLAFRSPNDTYIRGQVTDITNGNPIPFANVRLRGTAIAKRTDANGYYCIQISDGGVLEFSATNYFGKNKRISIEDNPVDEQLQPFPVKQNKVVDTIKRKVVIDTIKS